MAIAGLGNKNATTLGLPQSTKRWLQSLRSKGEMEPHNVGRPRGEEARLCLLVFHLRPVTSLELRVICVFSGDTIRRVFLPRRLLLVSLQTHPAVQSPVFANVCRHLESSSATQRPGVPRDAGDVWESCGCPLDICGPPTGEESAPDGAEQATPPVVAHIDVAAAWRSEEAAFSDLSCKTDISRSFGAILLLLRLMSLSVWHSQGFGHRAAL